MSSPCAQYPKLSEIFRGEMGLKIEWKYDLYFAISSTDMNHSIFAHDGVSHIP